MRTLFTTRRTLVIVLAVTALLLTVATIGVIGLLHGGGTPPSATGAATQSPGAVALPNAETVRPTTDAIVFSWRVATTLFDWDTTARGGPDAILDALMAVADPSDEDVPDLRADAAAYLPTAAEWAQLANYETTQRLVVDSAMTPDSWAGIMTDPANPLPAGTTAVTVQGTRVRVGDWFGQTARKQFPVAFTMFLFCPLAANQPNTPDPGTAKSSTEDSCLLLRLSILGEPLR